MTTGLVFQNSSPPAQPAPNRTDIACFIGFVRRRPGPLPDEIRTALTAAGWINGPWQHDAPEDPNDALQLPIAVESFDTFDALYAWDERPLRAGGTDHCATYLGAAVRTFFAAGGCRALIVRVGDPWPYFDPAVSRESQRLNRIRLLVPSFPGIAASGASFDAGNPKSWKGIHQIYGLQETSLVLLPDLADACALDPGSPSTAIGPPAGPEGFVECSDDEPASEDSGIIRLAAPRSDSAGFDQWRLAVAGVREFLTNKRRDCVFVGTLPLPGDDVSQPADPAHVYAEATFLTFLSHAHVLEPEGALRAPSNTAASAFVQLAWPWVATRQSADLPEAIEPPDGLLAGVIAASTLARGTFRSVAGTRLPEVLGATPAPAWGLGPDSPAARLAERVCLIALEPDGWSLVSDVTTSPDPSWRPGGVSRLMASVLHAATRVGEGMPFEPNGPRLWARLRQAMEDLLTGYWREGGLRGATTAEAFDVRCDRSIMSQNDIDNGKLIARVSLQPAAAIERMIVLLALDPGGGSTATLREVA
jgi:Bacteriophage tail sheath protein